MAVLQVIFSLRTFLELLVIGFIGWGIWNESRLIAFENRMKDNISELYIVLRQWARRGFRKGGKG